MRVPDLCLADPRQRGYLVFEGFALVTALDDDADVSPLIDSLELLLRPRPGG